MPVDHESIANEMAERADEWIGILSELIAIPSENPPGDTSDVATYFTSLLDERAIEYDVVAPREGHPNVVASFEGTPGSGGPHLGFNGHFDTFPVEAEDRWEHGPFSGRVVDGKVYGRGAADMHAGFTASLAAFLYLHEHREEFSGTVSFAATSDEETGSELGAKYLLANHPEYRPDAMINGEPSSNGVVRFGGRGAVWLRIDVRGESSHSAYPTGVDAIDALTEFVADVRRELESVDPVPTDLATTIREAREPMDEAFGDGATERVLDVQVLLNRVSGGTQINVVPARATGLVDVRLPIGVSVEEVTAAVEARRDQLPADVHVEETSATGPTYTDPDAPIVQHVRQAAGLARAGNPPALSCGLAMTDTRFYRLHGVPCAIYGPTPYNVGNHDEFVYVDDFVETVQTHAVAGRAYLEGPDGPGE